MREANERS